MQYNEPITNLSLQEAYDELSYYTLSHPDPGFVHQYIVDAFATQTATKQTKPITLSFALIGLYLAVEKGFTGRHVQQVQLQLAKQKKTWPTFTLPDHTGDVTVYEVLAIPEGEERDAMIKKWCTSVWNAYKKDHQEKVRDLLQQELG